METEAVAEHHRLDAEIADHVEHKNVIAEVVTVLTQLCQLDPNAAAPGFIQQDAKNIGSGGQSYGLHKSYRFTQCGEAVGLLNQATHDIQTLDTTLEGYKTQFGNMAEATTSDADQSISSRQGEKTTAENARATRAEDLSQAKQDLKSAEHEMSLIEETTKQLET